MRQCRKLREDVNLSRSRVLRVVVESLTDVKCFLPKFSSGFVFERIALRRDPLQDPLV